MRNSILWLLPACAALVSQPGCLPSPPERPDAGTDVDAGVEADAGSDAGTPDAGASSAQACPPSSSVLTSNMLVPRRDHSSTLLADGRVLLAGGSASGLRDYIPITDAELYEPATGTWTLTQSMHYTRYFHAATRLLDGRVLVTGGILNSSKEQQNTAELYDPATGTWSDAASMAEARTKHQSLLLGDGRVLVSGGMRVELYEPATNTWRTPPQLEQRYQAALLPDGRVLLLGASDAPTQLYDPATDTVTPTGSPRPQVRSGLLTARPDGRLMLLAQGPDSPLTEASADVYEPALGIWRPLPQTHGKYHYGFMRFSEDGLFVAGGSTYLVGTRYFYKCRLHVELYDPGQDRWCFAAPMLHDRVNPSMTRLLTGQYLVTGREDQQCEFMSPHDRSTVELYTPPQGF